ncbi:MAG: 4Fe-4S binding protein [Pygmaiobacter sp.]
MKINQLYFSPTGGTEKVVRLLSNVFSGEQCAIDFSVAQREYADCVFEQGELCIIGVPSFGGRAPALAIQRLAQMKAFGTPTVLVVAYGNRDFDDTLLELQDTVRARGFHVIAAIAAVTEHSIMHQFGTGRPQESDCSELCAYAEKIKQALATNQELPEALVPGNTPYREYGGLPMKPKAGKDCNGCGACVLACPAGAISPENPRETRTDLCITCMRCVARCPQHARSIHPALLFAAGKKMHKSCSSPKANLLFLG